jgi:hypothetical protein
LRVTTLGIKLHRNQRLFREHEADGENGRKKTSVK